MSRVRKAAQPERLNLPLAVGLNHAVKGTHAGCMGAPRDKKARGGDSLLVHRPSVVSGVFDGDVNPQTGGKIQSRRDFPPASLRPRPRCYQANPSGQAVSTTPARFSSRVTQGCRPPGHAIQGCGTVAAGNQRQAPPAPFSPDRPDRAAQEVAKRRGSRPREALLPPIDRPPAAARKVNTKAKGSVLF